jgi:NAD(P)H-dependent flavin oxidoreductase YrpB (nitropropane dioxygenase family)
VNLFAPNPVPISDAAYLGYRAAIADDAAGLGVELPAEPRSDDDAWAGKLELLLAEPVPVVSCTFGLPAPAEIAALRRAGSLVLLTVTSAAEARAAAELSPDGLVVQSAEAGAHYGTLTPDRLPAPLPLAELLAAVGAVTDLPLIGTGGIGTAVGARDAIGAGASAVAVGTALLRTPESGGSAMQKAALAAAAEAGTPTVVTRAFTGRPARGLRNRFTDRHQDAPLGYPALHYLTSPLRRAATAAGDPGLVSLWAGVAYRHAVERPAAEVIGELSRLL